MYLTADQAARRLRGGKKVLARAVERGDLTPGVWTRRGDTRFHTGAAAGGAHRSHLLGPVLARSPHISGAAAAEAGSPHFAQEMPELRIAAALVRLGSLALDLGSDVDAAVSRILKLLAESLDAGVVFLGRVDEDVLRIERSLDRASMGLPRGAVMPLRDSYCTTMLANASRSLVVEDAHADPAFATRAMTLALGIGAYSGVPLQHADGSLYGTFCVLYADAHAVRRGELELLALAGRLIMQTMDGAAARAADARAAAHAADLRRVARVSAIVAKQVDLDTTLNRIVRAAARGAGLRQFSILLLDETNQTLTHASSVGLPAAYIAAIDPLIAGPTAGTCGVAAYRRETVITEDLLTDPNWKDYRHLASPYGLRAVWSIPLLGGEGRVLGTFAAYLTQPGRPSANQREVLDLYARLTTVAVEAARSREREDRLMSLATGRAAELIAIVEQAPAGIIVLDKGGHATLMNERGQRLAGSSTTSDGRVPEKAAAYRLRDGKTGRELPPDETPLGRALAGIAVHEVDLLAQGAADADDRYVRASAVPLYDTEGLLKGAVGVFADVTREQTLLRDLTASEERLRTVYDAMACGVIVLDSEGAITDANAAALQILGQDLAALRVGGMNALRARVLPFREAPPENEMLTVFQTHQTVRDIALEFVRQDGETRRLHLDVVPVLDGDGRLLQVVLSFIDVTARARVEEALRTSEERVRTILSNAPVVLFALDRQGAFTLCEGRALSSIGLRSSQIVGTSVFDAYQSHPEILAAARQALAGEANVFALTIAGIVFETHCTPLHDVDGVLTGVIGVATDVTARWHMEKELRHQALHDALTDLPNRTLLDQRLREALKQEREDADVALALCLLDLDRFKEVNDALGHHAGDLLLRQVAARLVEVARPMDTVARLGGDEFAIVMPGADADAAEAAVAAIDAALAEPYIVEGHRLHLRASIGIALGPAQGQDGAILLRCADVAMYAAKNQGGGHAFYVAGQDAALPARLSLAADLRHAVTEGGLELRYQPQIELASGRVAEVEALPCWPHPVHGFVPSDQFMRLAEGMGIVGALTDWALEEAIRQCRAWRHAGHTLVVAVKIAATMIYDRGLSITVARLLRAYDVLPQSLRLEVTEGALMADPVRAEAALASLAELGVRISVDDYGTGYSSLATLKRLPVHELKIDRSFVKDLKTEESAYAIVASTIGLGHGLGLTVVAEGVEGRATGEALAALGCDRAQGAYWGQPMPAADLDALLRAR